MSVIRYFLFASREEYRTFGLIHRLIYIALRLAIMSYFLMYIPAYWFGCESSLEICNFFIHSLKMIFGVHIS